MHQLQVVFRIMPRGYSFLRIIPLVFSFAFVLESSFSQSKYSNDPSVLRDPTGYKVRSGDQISLFVRDQTETNLEVKIDGDGLIKPVYLNEMRVSGLSIKEIASLLTNEYQNQLIFKNPIVKVYIKKYSERVVYLTGSVNSKGPYTFPPEVEAMNIVEVISRSGGFSVIAKKNKVYVTRTFYDTEGQTKDTKTYEVNVEALSKGSLEHSSSRKFWIYPGDRIEVPERLI